eukprot:643294-Hanusia_phi.AAC.2
MITGPGRPAAGHRRDAIMMMGQPGHTPTGRTGRRPPGRPVTVPDRVRLSAWRAGQPAASRVTVRSPRARPRRARPG